MRNKQLLRSDDHFVCVFVFASHLHAMCAIGNSFLSSHTYFACQSNRDANIVKGVWSNDSIS